MNHYSIGITKTASKDDEYDVIYMDETNSKEGTHFGRIVVYGSGLRKTKFLASH